MYWWNWCNRCMAGSSGRPPVGFSVRCCWTTVRRSTKWTIPSFCSDCLLLAYLTASLTGSHRSFAGASSVLTWGTAYLISPLSTLFRRKQFGPVGFIIYINDLHTCLAHLQIRGRRWEVCSADATDSQLQRAAIETVQWSSINRMSVNCEKTKELPMCFARSKPDIPPITISDKATESVNSETPGRDHQYL